MSKGTELVTVGGNFLGPVLLATLVKSLTGIAVVNVAIFLAGLGLASRLPGVKFGRFFFLMILNPTLTPALLTVNKEIFAMLGAILFVRYVSAEKRSVSALALLFVVSMLARWEQAFVTCVMLALESRFSPLRARKKVVLACIVGIITFTYPVIVRTGVFDLSGMISFAQMGTLGPILNNIQAAYGFPLILVPKVLLNLFGHLASPSAFINDFLTGDSSDVQNFYVIPLSELAMLLVIIAMTVKRKWDLRKPSIYWCAIYIVVTAVSPVIQPRYQYPVYVIFALELSGLSNILAGTSDQEMKLRNVASIPS
jgi:uncharacterized membrane protein YhaH (DUF805 family)